MSRPHKFQITSLASLALLLFCLLPVLSPVAGFSADTFDVGGSEIQVPVPVGYVRVTEEMDAVERLAAQMTDPMNDQLAYYVIEADAPAAKRGEIPPLAYTCLLKVNKQIKTAQLSAKDFATLKEATLQVNQQLTKQLKSQIGDQLEKISEGISGEFDIDFAMQLSDVVPLDPHRDDANAFGYSIYIKYANADSIADGQDEQSGQSVVAASMAMVNASGKVLFLYVYAPEDELESTRKSSSAWADAVLAANSAPPGRSSGTGAGSGGFDWKRVLKMAIIGAIIGGLVGGIGALTKRRKG
jgi:hypothetical protein